MITEKLPLDRKEPPAFVTIDRIDVQRVQHVKLDNGIDLFTLSAGSQELSRIELVFRAGMYHQPRTLIASCTNTLLETGTISYTAEQISEGIDFYGSFLELHVEQDYATVTLYCLNKYLRESMVFLAEMVQQAVFPEHEFQIHLSTRRQKHAINSQKVNVLARRRFAELIFGPTHPYGIDVKEPDFERVSINELKEFYKARYNYSNCTIIASGKLPEDLRDTLNFYLGRDKWGSELRDLNQAANPESAAPGLHFTVREDAIQSAIRIGRLLFNKTHEDYFKFQVLNTLLGGYFGSRLMANIREDKGYTYGIGSGITNLVHGGYFYITTEVGAEVTAAAIDEIYREIDKLKQELVSDLELQTVKNYMLGNFLRSVDGPFALAEKFRSIWEFGLDYSFFDRYFAAVKSVSPKELRDLANKYLLRDHMIECVVGKMQA